jgi:uncharacterized protein (TIGR03437 family)
MMKTPRPYFPLTIAALGLSLTAYAQTSTDLRGIYVSGTDFPVSKQAAAALADALTVPGVDGLLFGIAWDSLEPGMNQYDWSTLDEWMGRAISLGRKVKLSFPAHSAPAWLFQPAPTGGGAKPLTFSYAPHAGLKGCFSETIAAPFDPAFQSQFDGMLAAVAAHLKSTGAYSAIAAVNLTGINFDSGELHLAGETAQSTGLDCVSDAVATWQNAGYRPSVLLNAWDAITNSFKKSFSDKYFAVAIIASTHPFPPIAEDGSVIKFTDGKALSVTQNLPLLTLASQKFPGRLVIQNNTLYPNTSVPDQTVQSGQTLHTLTAFQTNLDFGTAGGASCGPNIQQTAVCTDATFLAELETGIYPLGKLNPLRAQYIEVFAPNVTALPNTIVRAHFELAPPVVSLVANAEGEAPTIAPNTWVEIKGAGLSLTGDSRIWQGTDFVNNQMPTQLDQVGVAVNGKNAFVYYISPSQINILTPPDAMSGPVQVAVTNAGAASASFTAQAQPLSSSFFVFNGGPYLAAVHANGTLVGPVSLFPGSTTPAQPGETVVLYANGFGPTSTPVVSGSILQSGTLSPLPVVKIGGTVATVQFAGLVSPGEFQLNVIVPANTPDGDQAVTATYNGTTTQAGTVIAIQH